MIYCNDNDNGLEKLFFFFPFSFLFYSLSICLWISPFCPSVSVSVSLLPSHKKHHIHDVWKQQGGPGGGVKALARFAWNSNVCLPKCFLSPVLRPFSSQGIQTGVVHVLTWRSYATDPRTHTRIRHSILFVMSVNCVHCSQTPKKKPNTPKTKK